ncbi:hypothetical protein M409DRAFT_31006 [Zasmidium cellare ATCC 36951]|uniref:Enoyl reductase (ER) domain-containing protein n=1 Tax=Zasmidium cellare ATCC 36951 TaxID=1080233 RepID=A0A6A6BUN8_ZASCE|nr:uncharacterized protein M409DRAFT_31006 [Zasmidium cellare ATCC 36951]KAF2158507.1 hypothetical protein M409DRAFT_31006 [Zasmidium cellare ATCC 36951]
MTHQAAWIKAPGDQLEIGPKPTPTPEAHELLIRVNRIALNPIDAKLQKHQLFPYPYPNILGRSFAGTVERVGSDVKGFTTGDRVACLRTYKQLEDHRYGAFQQLAVSTPDATVKLDETASLAGAASLILNAPRPEKILVYGGSSSAGGLAIQYAARAGYQVITTSSPANRAFVTALEPAQIIDHTASPDAVLAELQSHGPYDTILDTIGLPAVTMLIVRYLKSRGGGKYHTLTPLMDEEKPLIPDNVERVYAPYGAALSQPDHADLKKWLFEEYIPKGLSTGVLVPNPEQLLKGGISQTQHGLDMLYEERLSGRKLVVDPWE